MYSWSLTGSQSDRYNIQMEERHKIICASYLVLKKDGQVLLLRRFNTGYEDGNYSIPAGHVDEGESVLSCLVREAKEEIGIDVARENARLVHVMHRSRTPTNDERLDFFFECTAWSGEVQNREPQKCDDLRWVTLDSLPENVIPYIKQALHSVTNKELYGEFYWQ